MSGIRRRRHDLHQYHHGAITTCHQPRWKPDCLFHQHGFYAADRAANTNWLIGPPLSGFPPDRNSAATRGSWFIPPPAPRFALDTNGIADVYLYDFVTRSNFLVSQSNPPGAPNGPSDSPAISNDGRFVAYRSIVTNIVSGVTNGVPNVFLYDRQTGINTLLSANASGAPGNNHSFAPQFSGDGQTVVFQSWASDLIRRITIRPTIWLR